MKRRYTDIPEGQVHYVESGRGQPLILLHQTAFSSDEYRDLIPLLCQHHRVIAMDTLGFGMSDPAPKVFAIEDYARTVKEFLDSIGIRQAMVYGHHTGASIALELAAGYPGTVTKLILSGCPLYSDEERRERLSAERFKPMQITADGGFLVDSWAMAIPRMPKTGPEGCLRWVLARIIAGARGEEAHQAVFRYPSQNRLPLVECPTLLISGDKDVFLDKLDKTSRLVKNCTTRVIPGGGSLAVEETRSLADAILGFIE